MGNTSGVQWKKIFIIFVIGLTVSLLYIFYKDVFKTARDFDEVLTEAAAEINKSCPMKIDGETRLDSAFALPGKIFAYDYTLVNLEKSQVNPDSVKKFLEPKLLSTIRMRSELEAFRKNNVTMQYNYRDKAGEFVMQITITPEMYGNSAGKK